jgi:hypothetical protein
MASDRVSGLCSATAAGAVGRGEWSYGKNSRKFYMKMRSKFTLYMQPQCTGSSKFAGTAVLVHFVLCDSRR